MKCPVCDSEDLEWFTQAKKLNGVVDGRLRMHEIGVEFFLGCNYCSETIKIVDGDKIANFLTEQKSLLDIWLSR